jgi:hypothetical protein
VFGQTLCTGANVLLGTARLFAKTCAESRSSPTLMRYASFLASRCSERYVTRVRTTVDIDDAALDRAKRLARRENRTLGSVLSDAIAAYVSKRPPGTPDPPFELIVRGKAGRRFPSPEEIARVEDDEEAQALRIPRVR